MIIRHCIGHCTLLQLPHAGRNPTLQMYQLVLYAFSCLFELLLLHVHISKYTPQARIYAHHDSLKALGAKLQTQMRVAYCKAIPVFPRLVRKEPWKQYPLLCSSFYHSLSLLMHIPGNSPPSIQCRNLSLSIQGSGQPPYTLLLLYTGPIPLQKKTEFRQNQNIPFSGLAYHSCLIIWKIRHLSQ